MARWKLTLAFDGSDFYGWQRQNDQRTAQNELEKALSTFLNQPIEVSGQGRTDRGVHADEQVAHVDLPENLKPEKLLSAMRGLLPPDIALNRAEPVDESFHSRFDAKSRVYRYQITGQPLPLMRFQTWFVAEELNRELLMRCAERVKGEHDFKNFAKIGQEESGRNTRCRIMRSEWEFGSPILTYRIEADRFLRHMVRRIVGSMVKAAAGSTSYEQFEQLMEETENDQKGFSAPSKGLILERVLY